MDARRVSACGQWRKAERSRFRADKGKLSDGAVTFYKSTQRTLNN